MERSRSTCSCLLTTFTRGIPSCLQIFTLERGCVVQYCIGEGAIHNVYKRAIGWVRVVVGGFLTSICPSWLAAAVCTIAVCPSACMVFTMPSAVSGFTKDDAASSAVVPNEEYRVLHTLCARKTERKQCMGGSGYNTTFLMFQAL
jgi:hypothetical protein